VGAAETPVRDSEPVREENVVVPVVLSIVRAVVSIWIQSICIVESVGQLVQRVSFVLWGNVLRSVYPKPQMSAALDALISRRVFHIVESVVSVVLVGRSVLVALALVPKG